MTVDESKIFFSNYDTYCQLFGNTLVDDILSSIDVRDFQGFATVVEAQAPHYIERGYIETGRGPRNFKEYRDGGFERTVSKRGVDFRVPCSYQSKEAVVLRRCIYQIAPYLKIFKIDVYKIYGKENPEIYVNTSCGSIL